jgi:crotonobetainyl-CoA:carnitine CoA-transferase CaiB-like acyl-CoA transferase
MDGKKPGRRGTLGNGGQPARVFNCKDGQVFISAGNQRQHEGLCKVLNVPELARDPRFATSPLRLDNREAWSAVVDPIVATWPKVALYEALVAARVPCSVINDYDEVFDDAHVRHRGLKINVPHPEAGERGIDMIANPLHFSKTPIGSYATPPCLGQHTDEILTELAGYSAEKIDRLRRQGAI